MALAAPAPTPGGPAVAVILCLLPLAFLVAVTLVKRIMLPTSVSLPAAAALMAAIRLAYLSAPPALVAACVVSGLLEALTPLTIIGGAIALFQTMEHTGCLAWIMGTVKVLSDGHPVAEVYLIGFAFAYLVYLTGFAFAYLVEGASGFGTPVALAAPMLASLGHDRLDTVCALLVFNTFATVFGAVGTPVWFGFSGVGLSEDNLLRAGFKASILIAASAFVIGPIAASFMVPARDVARSGLFVLLATASAVAPAVAISLFSYEFPTLAGGLISVAVTALLVRFKLRLRAKSSAKSAEAREDLSEQEFEMVRKLGSIPGFPMPMAVPIGRVDRGVQVGGGLWADGAAPPPAGTAAATACRNNGGGGGGGGGGGDSGGDDAEALDAAVAAAPRRTSSPKAAAAPGVGAATAAPTASAGAPAADGGGAWAWARAAAARTLPLTGTVALLMVTRIPALRIKGVLQSPLPRFLWRLGTLGDFGVNASLVVQLIDIMRAGVSWKYELLYVPFVLPFLAMSAITIALHRRSMAAPWWTPFREAFSRVKGIMVATFGALVLVQLIRQGGADSPAFQIGYHLSGALGQGFLAIGALLGAIGSFFSGSTTVSNLTFSEIQEVAAERLGMPVTSFLAVQAAGASSGNAFTISNILAAKAVMGMQAVPEAAFLRRTLPVGLAACLLVEAVGLVFTLGGVLPDLLEGR
ncbi:MAG: L-lactate permease-domain-containing protein [Monoraphidium minutum]|nr:MAG: L-lactate permease-domain-containing protein [Monoraphidium minutum]